MSQDSIDLEIQIDEKGVRFHLESGDCFSFGRISVAAHLGTLFLHLVESDQIAGGDNHIVFQGIRHTEQEALAIAVKDFVEANGYRFDVQEDSVTDVLVSTPIRNAIPEIGESEGLKNG